MKLLKSVVAVTLGTAVCLGFMFSKADKNDSTFKQSSGERTYPQGYFRLPMDIPIAISGTFGELRPNHFHTGLDFKTQQREGFPIYAIADGFVSRIRVQVWGFGNAAYLDHPNGYTSVYAHMQRFAPRLEKVLRTAQYGRQSFEVDFNLLYAEIPVKKVN